MSTTFNLTNSATEVNTALQAVVGADTTPDAASVNMVTSQGVFNHVNTELGPFKGKTLTTASTGIAATDNDDSVPTSAAVKDYVDNSTTAVFKVAYISESDNARTDSTYFFKNISVISDLDNIINLTNGNITFTATGTYLVEASGVFLDSDGTSGDYYRPAFTNGTASTTVLTYGSIEESSSAATQFTMNIVRTVSNTSTDKLAIYATPFSGAYSDGWSCTNNVIRVTKLA